VAHLAEPPLDLSVKTEPEHWAARVGGQVLPTGTVRLAGQGAVTALPGFAAGAWWVQDVAASLPARLLGSVDGRTVIDLCAAPGGKTAQLAAAGARVTAVERDALRLSRLADNLRRLSLSASVVAADVESWRPPAAADAVLLDAPCTATGTIRRHPDLSWARRPGDVVRLAKIQDRLLRAAAEMVRPGGVLVYAVCSLQPEEGPQRIAALLASGAPYRREPVVGGDVGGLDMLIDAAGDLRSLPCHLADSGGMDGFYACRLRRCDEG
jgi:16S rRNA (cytosine967-C5)-methyltransferase